MGYSLHVEEGTYHFLRWKIYVRSRKNIEVFSSCCIQRLIQKRYSDCSEQNLLVSHQYQPVGRVEMALQGYLELLCLCVLSC